MSRSTSDEPTPLVGPELTQLLCAKADELITRLMNRYLPDQGRGYVGDDQAIPTPAAQEPYRVLGLARTASDAEVKRRVRDLAKVFHPDLPSGSAEKMADVNDAAKRILDERGRKRR